MTRPSAAYVGMIISHPIRLAIHRGPRGDAAKLLSVAEALELATDLTTAIARALDREKARLPRKDDKNNASINPRDSAAADADD